MTSHHGLTRALSRRAVLLGGAAVLTGCTAPRTEPAGSGPDRPESTPASPVPPSASPMPPPALPAYEPPAGDALPNFKRVAGRFAQAVATYDAGERLVVPADYLGDAASLEAAAAPLRTCDGWARAEVDFVQYGGLTPVSPSATSGVAMVVLRQLCTPRDGRQRVQRRSLDLRLGQVSGVWRVEQLASAGGAVVAEPESLSPVARQVLDDGRLHLPDSARWDILSGQVVEPLLHVMLALAEVTPLRVTALKTGHPERVVDGRVSAPVSAHWLGKAVDIYALDGVSVAQSPPAVVRGVVEAAFASPLVAQIGAPPGGDLDGPGRRSFTNLVHADHVHVAVKDPG